MNSLRAILALLTAIAGWHYLFYSPAAKKLQALEDEQDNRTRQRLRRINGGVLLLLAAFLVAGFYFVDEAKAPQAFLLVWFAVFILLLVVVTLAVLDIRLTGKLRHRR